MVTVADGYWRGGGYGGGIGNMVQKPSNLLGGNFQRPPSESNYQGAIARELMNILSPYKEGNRASSMRDAQQMYKNRESEVDKANTKTGRLMLKL